MNNYAIINGKRIELTDAQVKTLGIETKTNPFNRMGLGSYIYTPNIDGTARTITEDNGMAVNHMYRNCNYFNDKAFAEQVALHQLLYRKLLKFAYDNECENTAEWNEINAHWCIYMDTRSNRWDVTYYVSMKFDDVYFSSEKGAKRAIEEVVEPFLKEHPEFVW